MISFVDPSGLRRKAIGRMPASKVRVHERVFVDVSITGVDVMPMVGDMFLQFPMSAIGFRSELAHFAQHCDASAVRFQIDQRSQSRLHRIRIGVVTVVNKLHAVDLTDLQTRFR